MEADSLSLLKRYFVASRMVRPDGGAGVSRATLTAL